MATERLNILVKFTNTGKAAMAATRKSVAGIGVAASKSTKLLSGMVGQLTLLVGTVGGGAFFKNAIATFTQFDDVMRQAGAVTGATAEEMIKMTEVAKEMGATTRFTASDAADGLRLLGMAGFEAGEAIDALPGVLNLAAAGSLELGQSADIATNILSGFGLEVEKLGTVNDVLVKTFTSSNTTLVELGESFKLVGPIAKGVGADFEELLAAIGKLGDAGLKGTLSGTALRGAINALLNPTNEEAKLMDELAQRIGVTSLQVKDAEGNFIGFTKVVEQLEKAGIRGDEALKLFGQRAGPAMAALIQTGSASLNKMTAELRRAGGTAEDIAEQMEAGIGGATRQLAAAFEGLKITIGEAFEDDVTDGIVRAKELIISLTAAIEELKRNGTIEAYARAFEIGFDVISGAMRGLHAIASETTKVLIALGAALTGNFDIAGEAIKDLGSDIDSLLVSYDLLDTVHERESRDIQSEIRGIEERIAATKRSIKANEEYLQTWRANLPGAERVREELEKQREELGKLESSVLRLSNKKAVVDAKIDLDEIDALAQVGQWSRDSGHALEMAAENSGPIGKGTQKIQEATNKVVDPKAASKALRNSLRILRAELNAEAAAIENEYAQGLISLDQYFTEREALVKSRIGKEIELLSQQVSETSSVERKTALNAAILAKENQLAAEIIKIEGEKYKAIESVEQRRVQERENLNQLEVKAEKAHQDQLDRIKTPATIGLQATFSKEIADLQTKQNEELIVINEFYNRKLELLRENKAQEAEIEAAYSEKQKAVKEQERLQEEEAAQLALDQQHRAATLQLDALSDTAGNISSVLLDVYELSGKKNEELFVAAKAFSIAQALMKTYESATSAYAAMSGIPYVGPALGAAAAGAAIAAGLANVANIRAQNYAQGGKVLGYSPTSTSDNIDAKLTAGEFVHPVSSVRKYGLGAMEAIRRGSVPPEVLSRFSVGGIRYGNRQFASGGAVTPQATPESSAGQGFKINNFIDPALYSQHMQTSAGQRDVWNVLSANPYKLKQLVMSQ